MKKSLIIALMLTFVVGITGVASAAASQNFADVPSNHWAYAAVNELARVGIIDGYGDKTFRGDKTLSRYEMAQVVEKAMNNANKASAVQKALIDKLAIEFALELNKIDTRVTKLEKNQPNLKLTGSYTVQYKMRNAAHYNPDLINYAKGQYKLQLNGVATVDQDTSFTFRIADPAPTATRFRDSTQADFGDVTDNALKLDRLYGTTKVGDFKVSIGRQAMEIDPEDFIVDSSFFNYDGIKVAWKFGAIDADYKRGRFARKITDVYAFNGRPASDFKNIDIDNVNLSGKEGKMKWNAGWASFKNNIDTVSNGQKELMAYYFGALNYQFGDTYSMGFELGQNKQALRGGQFWSIKGVYGAQKLDAAGKQNFTIQYTNVQDNTIATAYTALDPVREGVSDAFKTLDFNYRYAFSKNMVGKIQHTFVTDKVNDLESYSFWKVQLVYKF